MKKKKSKKWIIIVIIVLVIIFGITSCVKSAFEGIEGGSFGTSTMLYKVDKQDISEYINASGTISSDAIVSITSNLTGAKVTDVFVEVGDTVTNGQKIATVDVSELRQELNEYRAMSSKRAKELEKEYNNTVAERDEELASIQEEIDNYTSIIDKCTEAPTSCDDDLTSAMISKATYEKDYNKTKKNYDKLIESASDAMNEADPNANEIKELQNKINGSTIYAPSDGIVTSLNINKGSIIADTTVGIVQNSDDYKVTVSISESSILKVKKGMPVSITVVATGDKEYSGTITKVVKLPTTSGDFESVGYKAVISIDDKNTELLIGMTAKCKIYLSETTGKVLAVPYDAIHEDNEGQKYVYVLKVDEKDSTKYKIEYRNVTVGHESNYYTEIKDGLVKDEVLYVSEDEVDNGETFDKETIDMQARYLGGKDAKVN